MKRLPWFFSGVLAERSQTAPLKPIKKTLPQARRDIYDSSGAGRYSDNLPRASRLYKMHAVVLAYS
ncbi:MAG: hypothetical protein ACREP9_07300, partial [Candidatus Dormibacteraceae bacterium]